MQFFGLQPNSRALSGGIPVGGASPFPGGGVANDAFDNFNQQGPLASLSPVGEDQTSRAGLTEAEIKDGLLKRYTDLVTQSAQRLAQQNESQGTRAVTRALGGLSGSGGGGGSAA